MSSNGLKHHLCVCSHDKCNSGDISKHRGNVKTSVTTVVQTTLIASHSVSTTSSLMTSRPPSPSNPLSTDLFVAYGWFYAGVITAGVILAGVLIVAVIVISIRKYRKHQSHQLTYTYTQLTEDLATQDNDTDDEYLLIAWMLAMSSNLLRHAMSLQITQGLMSSRHNVTMSIKLNCALDHPFNHVNRACIIIVVHIQFLGFNF